MPALSAPSALVTNLLRRYTSPMRECTVSALVLLLALPASAQVVPAGWKIIKEAKGACQIAVPPDWDLLSAAGSAAVFHDPTTAIAVVTSQPGQTFKPLSDAQLKTLDIRKENLFENTVKRLYYLDKTSSRAEDANAYSVMVPGRRGTCSCRVVVMPSIPEDVVKKIALSLGPVAEGAAEEQR